MSGLYDEWQEREEIISRYTEENERLKNNWRLLLKLSNTMVKKTGHTQTNIITYLGTNI